MTRVSIPCCGRPPFRYRRVASCCTPAFSSLEIVALSVMARVMPAHIAVDVDLAAQSTLLAVPRCLRDFEVKETSTSCRSHARTDYCRRSPCRLRRVLAVRWSVGGINIILLESQA